MDTGQTLFKKFMMGFSKKRLMLMCVKIKVIAYEILSISVHVLDSLKLSYLVNIKIYGNTFLHSN